jgi:high-affinity iron transporter
MTRPRRSLAGLVLAGALLAPAAALAAPAALPPAARAATARRVLTLLHVVAVEYAEGVADGQVVRPIELEEARVFLAEAGQQLATLGHAELDAALGQVRAAIDDLAPADDVAGHAAALRARLASLTGVRDAIAPPHPPLAARGQPLFATHCASCHGEAGDGRGPDAARLDPPPASFVDREFMRGETPADFFHVISAGRRSAAMPAWDEALSVQERWDLVAYVWQLRTSPAMRAHGQALYHTHCAGCHGAVGEADGPLAPPPASLRAIGALADRTDRDLFETVSHGRRDTPMPAFAHRLDEEERWALVAYVRSLAFDADGAPNAAPAPDALAEAERLLDAALAAYRAGDGRALPLVSDAYFAFDPLEPRLRLAAPPLTPQIEARFLALRGAIAQPGAGDQVTQLVEQLHADFAAVRRALAPRATPYAVFLQSAAIILREGFEVVLVIGALLAYVVKTGHAAMRRPLLAGAGTGLALSLLTAYGFLRLWQAQSGAAVEALEGATMLLAAVVLFWVSYWLISKAGAERWQRFIQGQVKTALARGSGLALAGTGFLAVYREGVETVLFYQALRASADGAGQAVLAGLVAGTAALGAVSTLFVRFGMRMPLQPFFLCTSLLLYFLAFVFAGRGVTELQEAGWISVTPVPGVPAVDLLGLHPSVESLAVQAVLLGLALYAAAVTWRRRSGTPDLAPLRAGGRTATG